MGAPPTPLQLLSLQENGPGGVFELALGQKRVFFVRHGESFANLVHDQLKDGSFRDSPLTPAGHQQAASLRGSVAQWNVQLVVVSPLTRALQTACHAFANAPGVRLIATPWVTEFPKLLCDSHETTGRPVEILRQDPALASLPNFASISFDNVGPDWWSINAESERLHNFMQMLQSSLHTRIAVVAHGSFINNFLKLARNPVPLMLQNCSVVDTVWGPAPEPPREYALWLVPSSTDATSQALDAFAAECRGSVVLSNTTFMSRSRGQLHIPLSGFTALHGADKARLLGQLQAIALKLLSQRGARWTVSPDSFALLLDNTPTAVWLRVALRSKFLSALGAKIQKKLPAIGAVTRVSDFGLTLLKDVNAAGCVPLGAFAAVAAQRHALVKSLIDGATGAVGVPPVGHLLRGLENLSWNLCLVSRVAQSAGDCDLAFEPLINLPLVV